MPHVALRGISKRYGQTAALRGANLEIAPGEVHALLGENGAGKSTLVRVLYGSVRPDAGEILLDGKAVRISGPREALERGIGLVHQHFMLVPALSVAENLILGEAGGAWLSRQSLRERAREVLERFELELDPDAPTDELAVAQKQRLEIARALSRGARLLVLDEPTAVLAPSEIDALLALIARLRDEGRSVVFISHKLDEITAVCDRVTVLRAGETVATQAVAGMTAETLARMMVGDELPPSGQPPETERGDTALRIRGLRAPGLAGVDLEVRAGEILGLAGIDGNGQGALEQVLAGVLDSSGGSVEVSRGPLALLSADRHETGLVLELSVEENLILPEAASGGGPPLFTHGWVSTLERGRIAQEAIERFEIRASPELPVAALSGGNQQKVCVARALRAEPRVLVAINPTRGLDVGATAFVREEIRRQARAGAAVLLISTELDEILELAQRIAVLHRGRVLPVEPERHTRERIGQLMLGDVA